jgi:chromate transporter
MEDEVVTRRAWVTRDEFADLVGVANLIPGPNSTELAIHLGYRRAGWPGLVAAGVCFIVPAVLIVWGMAWGYGRFGTRVEVGAALAGMQPAVLAVVVQATWRLRAAFVRTRVAAGLALAALAAVLAGVPELMVLLVAVALSVVLAVAGRRNASRAHHALAGGGLGAGATMGAGYTTAAASATAAPLTPAAVFVSFAKIGSVLYGSGYVLLSFLRGEFGARLHALTDAQLLDAIAVGQVTPGPVFSAATFVGYLLAGHAGALAATLGIFLPAFIGVALTAPFVRALRNHPRLAPALEVINAVSLALMLSVVVLMARGVAASALGLAIFVATSVVLLTTRVGAGWVLLAGGLAGLLRLL